MSNGKKKSDPALTAQPQITHNDIQNIIADQIKPIREALKTAGSARQDKWNHPWTIALGSAVVGGTVVGLAFLLLAHFSADSKRDIADEITRQLDERHPQENENLKNLISAEVTKQLTPMNQTLTTLSQDIGKIKDHLHIAQIQPPALPRSFAPEKTTEQPTLQVAKPPAEKLPAPPTHSPESPSFQAFAEMDTKALAASLPRLRNDIQQASTSSTPPPDQATIRAISQKLAGVNPAAPQYWPTVASMITYQTWLGTGRPFRLTTAPQLRRCVRLGGKVSRANIDAADTSGKKQGCIVDLDNVDLTDSTISNAVILFSGTGTRLTNVRFVDCVFLVNLGMTPESTAQYIARGLLTGGPTVTITSPPV